MQKLPTRREILAVSAAAASLVAGVSLAAPSKPDVPICGAILPDCEWGFSDIDVLFIRSGDRTVLVTREALAFSPELVKKHLTETFGGAVLAARRLICRNEKGFIWEHRPSGLLFIGGKCDGLQPAFYPPGMIPKMDFVLDGKTVSIKEALRRLS
jgi:hypothetical protein